MPAPGEKNLFAGRDVVLTQFRIRNAGEKDGEKAQADLKKGFLDYLRAHGGFGSVTEGEAPTQGGLVQTPMASLRMRWASGKLGISQASGRARGVRRAHP